VVLLPVRVLTGLTPEQIEAVIAHELAHVRRHDYLVNLIQSAVEAALFYHPAVWWVSRGIRAEREYCCDDAAVRVSTDRVSYARALTTLESWRIARPAVGMSTLGGSLMVRVQRLIGIQSAAPRPRGALSFLGFFVGASALAAVALGNAAPVQDPEDLQAL
jgi:beta-lactamase regulating signal transducer with metallopeptidase domain